MENDKIILLTNVFQHLHISRNLSERKTEFTLSYLVRKLPS